MTFALSIVVCGMILTAFGIYVNEAMTRRRR
jgi:hypothetical protein